MSTVTIELPDEVVPSAVSPEEFAREPRLAAAIHWYSRGQISQGKGAQIAGMDRRSFILALVRAGVDAIQVSAQELKAEVESELEARRQRVADFRWARLKAGGRPQDRAGGEGPLQRDKLHSRQDGGSAPRGAAPARDVGGRPRMARAVSTGRRHLGLRFRRR